MAPHFGHDTRCPAHRTANGGSPRDISSANSLQIGRPQGFRTSTRQEGSRARETQRKRDRGERRGELKVRRSPIPTLALRRPGRLADRVMYGHGGEEHGLTIYDSAHDPLLHPQQGRSLRERGSHDGVFGGDGGSVQPLSLPDSHHNQAVNTDSDIRDNTDMDVDDFADLFGPEPPPPRPPRQLMSTKPIQYGSSHHLPFNLHLHPARPVQPATRREPIRLLNSFTPHEPDIDGPLPGTSAQPPSSPPTEAPEPSKHPVNPYKGNDPIKKRVQNKLLRCILAGKPLPKPRKKVDRMVLKCAGRQEFR